MKFTVKGHKTYAYTGGKPFNPAQPTVEGLEIGRAHV